MEINDSTNMSLDEYIRRKNIAGSLFMDLRKRSEKIIDKDKLDESLDEIAKRNAVCNNNNNINKKNRGKFDRFDNSSDEENDDEIHGITDNDDIEMKELKKENSSIRFAKEIEKMDHPQCCRAKHFDTVEKKMGIRLRSQQWRIAHENLDRPSGVPRLVALPLDDEERFKKVYDGRISKNYRNNDRHNVRFGKFIEKGNFTYKYKNNSSNYNENEEDVMGIVRNKPVHKIISRHSQLSNNYNNPKQPININMNWNGFFNGMTKCMQSVQPAVSQAPINVNPSKQVVATSADNLEFKFAAKDLFNFLVTKRDKNEEQQTNIKCETSSFEDICASAGEGIDMNVTPSTTNLPLNLRFA